MNMVLSAQTIQRYTEEYGMISPFVPEKVRKIDGQGIVSYGLGSGGYDIRLTNEYKVCDNTRHYPGHILDVKDPASADLQDYEGPYCIIPPHSFALGSSVEYFRIPPDVIGLALGKSTYSRMGINAIVNPLEPGWEGYLTIEVVNSSGQAAKIYSFEGIVQIVFLLLDEATAMPYQGRYQHQRYGVVLPSMEA